MQLYQLIAIALITAIVYSVLRPLKPEIATCVLVCGGVLILLATLNLLSDTVKIFSALGDDAGIASGLIKTVIKVVGIGYLVEFSASTVEELGGKSLADKLVFAGKISVLLVSLPIINALFSVINGLVRLI